MSIYASGGILAYCIAVAAVLGAVFGSFLTCAADRVAQEKPWWTGRSRCDACGHTLTARELVPVLSWVVQRGRCRSCGAKLSVKYPLTELCFAALTAACLLRFDLTPLCLRNWVFLCCLFCLSLVDLQAYWIPDTTLVIPALLWLATLPALQLSRGRMIAHLLAAVGFSGAIWLLSLALKAALGREAMGFGDIKLFALTGLYLGPVSTLFAVLLSTVLGLAFQRLRGFARGEAFPYGPSIAAAAAFMLLWGGGLEAWYLGLMGF